MRKKKTSKKRLTLYKGNKLNGSQSLEGKNAPKVSRSPSPPVKTNRIKKERLFPEGLPLTVTHPHFAKQAYGWDPSLVTYGSNNVLIWQCEVCEVTWDAMPLERTVRGTKVFCPKCPRIKRGSKSLAEEFPEIALEADGWDPSLIYSHSDLILSWRCSTCRNPWPARVANRTRDLRSGCPWCLTKGKMPLSFSYPEIASEAYGWNSNKVTQYGDGELEWKCNKCGNIWSDTLTNRTVHGYECEKCGKNTRPVWLEHNGQRFRKANDDNRLSVLFPELLKELVDKEIGELASYGAELKVDWKCSVCGHPWPAEIRSRTQH
jgi:predicted RNA-binding Zn-ribbon protein involved in translation (DUF1610 family)